MSRLPAFRGEWKDLDVDGFEVRPAPYVGTRGIVRRKKSQRAISAA